MFSIFNTQRQMDSVVLLKYEAKKESQYMKTTEKLPAASSPRPPPSPPSLFFPPSLPLPPPPPSDGKAAAAQRALNYRQHRAFSLVAPPPEKDADVEFNGHKFVRGDHLKPHRLFCAFCKESIQWFGKDSYRLV